MSEVCDNQDLQFWQAMYEVLQYERDTVPYCTYLERPHWTHPGESLLTANELIGALSQINPFPTAARESAAYQQ